MTKRDGKYMRKNPIQGQVLQAEFDAMLDEGRKWGYNDKIRIGALIGMSHIQVGKWMWDQCQQRGISTKRQKKTA